MSNEDNNAWPFQVDNVHSWAYWDKLFTDEECDEILKIAKKSKLKEGSVVNGSESQYDNVVNIDYRKSNISFIGGNDLHWVFRRLTDVCVNLNERFFGFDIWGFGEGLQFTEYKTPGGKYDSHVDTIHGSKIRKLSVVIQLTDPKKYKGCDLELLISDPATKMSRERGTLIMFPSYTLHRVTPIEKGTRHSIVGWITGKPFK